MRSKVAIICQQCGKKHFVLSGFKDKAKFCSNKCVGKYMSSENGPTKKKKIRCICKQCKKEFFIKPSETKTKGRGSFCSHKCHNLNVKITGVYKGKLSPNYKGKIKRICQFCKKPFEVDPNIVHRLHQGKYCSCHCRALAVCKRGEECNLWKGGVYPLNKLIRLNFRYRQWRSDVFTRDKFTCQKCGQRKGCLDAHHIKLFSTIIAEYKIKTMEQAVQCEELWNINNGMTLCRNCHKRTTHSL